MTSLRRMTCSLGESRTQRRRWRRGRGPHSTRTAGGGIAVALVAGGTAFLLTGGLLTIGARVMARFPLIPHSRSRPDLVVRAVHPDRVHLDATEETARPGVLALRQQGGAVHLRLGDVLGRPTPTTVARPILARDTPVPLDIGPAQANGFFWAGDPRSAHSLEYRDVDIHSPVGRMPAWLVPPTPSATADPDTWVIMIHGHSATRGEALRALPLMHALGLTSLVITYRNDTGAPPSADSMHHLGAAEWEDADAAVAYALQHGARRVVLMGWSMGGGISLRTSVLSEHRDRITALVLDSPAVDWQDILRHHARALRAPRLMQEIAGWMLISPLGRRMVALHEPIALTEMRPDFYAQHLNTPALLLHAAEDRTVPKEPSHALARLRPDLIEHHEIADATHTREWNVDPAAWEHRVGEYLIRMLDLPVAITDLSLPRRDPGAPPGPHAVGTRL
ncbi:MAG: alpha/beta hydrolase [Brachybacterium sp.]|nr:alpha/beta hydrolase [Brachybacterium sp.]